MLEQNLQNLVDKIAKIEHSHLNAPSDKVMMSDDWKFIFEEFDGWLVLGASVKSCDGYLIYPKLYPEAKIDDALKGDIHEYSPDDNDSVAYSYITTCDSGEQLDKIEPFWEENTGFNNSEIPLYFERSYCGRPKGDKEYIEFNQLVTHLLNLHWSPIKHSYCLINKMGEEIEKIKFITNHDKKLIVIKRKALDKLLHLGKWVLVRYFEFRRELKSEMLDTMREEPKVEVVLPSQEFQGKFKIQTFGKDQIECSKFIGVQIIKPTTPKQKAFSDDEEQTEKYASFIIHDLKNNKILEDYSIAPKNFANCFTKSKLPWEMSPIFFKAEVLDKYKNDPDKYTLNERNISCHGGWYLQTFDVNEHNQVHTYAVYLSRLPYKEQLHWASYNEKPKGKISKRASQTDFMAQYADESKLSQLRQSLEKLGGLKMGGDIGPIWSPKGGNWENASKLLHELKTENSNQWHEFILALSVAVNEGFQTQALRKIASHYGNKNKELKTLGLLKFIIKNAKKDESLECTYDVLNDLQIKKSAGKSHGEQKAPKDSFVKNAQKILDDTIIAVKNLYKIFEYIKLVKTDILVDKSLTNEKGVETSS